MYDDLTAEEWDAMQAAELAAENAWKIATEYDPDDPDRDAA